MKLNNKIGTFYVPFEDYIELNKSLESIGYLTYEIEIINDNEYIFRYNGTNEQGWDDISAILKVRKNKINITGKGSKNFRDNIISAYNWFIKALNDNRYEKLFGYDWF